MEDAHWGHCRTCKYFASPARVPLGGEEARCEQSTLSKYELTVFGANGCNAWELRAGLPKQTEQPATRSTRGRARGNGGRRRAPRART